MTRYYTTSRFVGRLKPLAWVTSRAPIEILEAMGIASVCPEDYRALCGARRAATPLCEVAEVRGYSQDLCSYARSSLGSLWAPDEDPMGELPKPALLLCCNNICGKVLKWYQAVAAHCQVPLYVLDMPYVHNHELPPHAIDYVTGQLEDLIGWLAFHTLQELRPDRLHRVVSLSNQAVGLWKDIRELCTARTSPLNATNLFTNMVPVVVMRGTRAALDYYRKLYREVAGRVERREGALGEEKYRLLWDNIAVWPRIFRLFGEFAQYGARFLADTYTNTWPLVVAEGDPLVALAKTYLTLYINMSLQTRAEGLVDLARRFEVGGAVFHSNRSCKPYSTGNTIFADALQRRQEPPVSFWKPICATPACMPRSSSARASRPSWSPWRQPDPLEMLVSACYNPARRALHCCWPIG